jgi:hypothetical protein
LSRNAVAAGRASRRNSPTLRKAKRSRRARCTRTRAGSPGRAVDRSCGTGGGSSQAERPAHKANRTRHWSCASAEARAERGCGARGTHGREGRAGREERRVREGAGAASAVGGCVYGVDEAVVGSNIQRSVRAKHRRRPDCVASLEPPSQAAGGHATAAHRVDGVDEAVVGSNIQRSVRAKHRRRLDEAASQEPPSLVLRKRRERGKENYGSCKPCERCLKRFHSYSTGNTAIYSSQLAAHFGRSWAAIRHAALPAPTLYLFK